ncbi:ankyrin, partial [Lojkania enalia]
LLDTGTNPNLKDIEGLTALHRSSQNGQISLVRLLLERGRNIHIDEKDKDGKSALHWAAENGHAEVATLLMEKGADVNAIEPVFRYTPLHTAAWNGHESVVRRLLEKKPN